MEKTAMLKAVLLIAALMALGGCYAAPRIEVTERIEFNYLPDNHKPMTPDDLLCCVQCQA